MKKVCVVINSRANFGRIRSFLKAVQNNDELTLQIVVGASALLHRFGMAIDSITSAGFQPSAKLYSIVEGETPVTMAKSTGLAITELSTIFESLTPDIVLTIADRFETLATAVAASYMNIPLAHLQGGEQTGSIDESVRHAITKLAHYHFPATEQSAKNIIQMGENPDNVHNVGCPSLDGLSDLELDIPRQQLQETGVGAPIDPDKPYLVVLQHPVTTEYGAGLHQINETIQAVDSLGIQAVWLWPNVDAGSDDISKGLRTYRENSADSLIRFFRNFEPDDYYRIIANCSCLIGNSSSGLREGAYLGVPVVNIGTRQILRERGSNVISVNYSHTEIVEATNQQLNIGKYPSNSLYGDGNAGAKMARIIEASDFSINKTFHVR